VWLVLDLGRDAGPVALAGAECRQVWELRGEPAEQGAAFAASGRVACAACVLSLLFLRRCTVQDEVEMKTQFVLSFLGLKLEYYIRHLYRPSIATITWTLDYSRASDFGGYLLHTETFFSVCAMANGPVLASR
jgi:hypothetical protein